MPLATVNLAAAAGQSAITPGDGTGALALSLAGAKSQLFKAAGSLGNVQLTLADYAAQFGGSLGRDAAVAQSATDSATAVRSQADAKRQSVEGVNIDEELINLTTYQQAFQALQAFDQGAGGPLNGKLTAAQEAFLTAQLTNWATIGKNLTTQAAQNGLVQKQVDDTAASLVTQSNSLTIMIGHITNADLAKAATDLSNAQLSVQASARVLQALQSSSLLNLLPAQ